MDKPETKVLFYKKKRIHYPSIFVATYYWNLLQKSGKLGRKSWNLVNLEPFFPWKIHHTCRNCSFQEEIWQNFSPNKIYIYILNENSINSSFFGNFSPTFPYHKIEARKKKKKKKNRIGTGWGLRLAKRFSYKWYLTNSIEEIEVNMASMFPPSRSPSSG